MSAPPFRLSRSLCCLACLQVHRYGPIANHGVMTGSSLGGQSSLVSHAAAPMTDNGTSLGKQVDRLERAVSHSIAAAGRRSMQAILSMRV